MKQAINIIFDGPPSHEAGRFVEVETDDGKSIRVGEWIKRGGYWALRITELPDSPPNNKLKIDAPKCKECGGNGEVLTPIGLFICPCRRDLT